MSIKDRWQRLKNGCGFTVPNGAARVGTARQQWDLYRRFRAHDTGVPTYLSSVYGSATTEIVGRELETPYGTCFYRETWLPAEPQFDWSRLRDLPAALFCPGPNPLPGTLDAWLFVDLETTGLAGGVGTVAFMVGLAGWDAGGLLVRQYFLRDLDEEPAMLWQVVEHLRQSAGMVTYNGQAFDRHILHNRLVLNRMDFDILAHPHVDLYHWARRIWGHRGRSVTLQAVEQSLWNASRTLDIPSSEIPHIYRWYLHSGWHEALLRVFEHNLYDLKHLAGLALVLGGALQDQDLLPDPEDRGYLCWHIGQLWSRYDWRIALDAWARVLDPATPAPPKLRSKCLVYGLRLLRRRRAWGMLPGWLATLPHYRATDLHPGAWALAAFYAYRFLRDRRRALAYLEKALDHPSGARDQRDRWQKRRQWLIRKLQQPLASSSPGDSV